MNEPPQRLLSLLGVRLVAPLGGRCNEHWLVSNEKEKKVLRRWTPQPIASIEYERRLIAGLAALGWPVAPLEDPIDFEASLWSLAPVLPGEPHVGGHGSDPQARGRLLAELHADTARLEDLGQRPGWRRCEKILADPELDRVLSQSESTRPEEVRIVRWHLDRARRRVEGLRLEDRLGIPVHGDFAPWNLHFEGNRLTGLLDFELSRQDHRIADFALAWRGKYDAVVEGYEEISPLSPGERAAIVPVWWAELIEGACRDFRLGRDDGGWTVGKLLTRSPLMGPDAEALPPG